MFKLILRYGVIAGLIVAVPMLWRMLTATEKEANLGGLLVGYLTMLVALTAVFLGVKQYRDRIKGGVIRFLPALGMGLAIGLVAVIAYVLIWEIYLAATHYAFIDLYFSGTDPEVVAMREAYSNPLIRAGYTALELAPVAGIMALVSAALLRNPRLLPARR
jgi:hypothetical protein